ncbi:hypothetical protein J6590_018274 [Homalodisca vitripennis]|nr:hypothetical protein J6590_018274 [Homalodisca vitripennis]
MMTDLAATCSYVSLGYRPPLPHPPRHTAPKNSNLLPIPWKCPVFSPFLEGDREGCFMRLLYGHPLEGTERIFFSVLAKM